MTYPFTLFLAAISFFSGVAFGDLVFILISFFTRKRKKDFRLSLLCLSLSLVIVFVALTILNGQFSLLSFTAIDWVWSLVILILGVCGGISYKKILPVIVAVYGIVCVVSLFFLLSKDGLFPKQVNVLVSDKYIEIKNQKIYLQDSNENVQSIVIQTNHISERLPLPLPYLWLNTIGVTNSSHSNYSQNIESEKHGSNHFFARLYANYDLIYIELPKENVYPVLYSLLLSPQGKVLKLELERVL